MCLRTRKDRRDNGLVLLHFDYLYNHISRGCTGFDGGFEIVEAIRRLGLRQQLRIKIKRKR